MIRKLYKEEVARSGIESVQILSPFRSEGEASAQALNEAIREDVNPAGQGQPEVMFGGRLYRLADRVMQTRNNYDLQLCDRRGKLVSTGVFNGEIGTVCRIQPGTVTVDFDGRFANYPLESLNELELAHASTIHKAQGSECDTVIIPLLGAHRILLSCNLLYTAITRAKSRVWLVGQKKALFMAIHKKGNGKRNTLLDERMKLYHHTLLCKNGPDAETGHEPMKKAG